jgi:hypothetical protein
MWHLLAGRSPFALPEGPNTRQDLIHRITHVPVARTSRDGVPVGLERLLQAAMAKNPGERPASALEFARSLQEVAGQAGYEETHVEILDLTESGEPHVVAEDDDDEETQDKVVIADVPAEEDDRSPEPIPAPRLTVPTREDAEDDLTHGRLGEPHEVEITEHRPQVPEVVEPPAAPVETGPRRTLLIAAAGLVVAGGVVAAIVLNGPPNDGPVDPSPTTTSTLDPAPAVVDVVPTPTDLTGARQPDGSVIFTWQSPEPADGDRWKVVRVDGGADHTAQLTDEPTFTVQGVAAGAEVCIEVALRRIDGRTSAEPAEVCAG